MAIRGLIRHLESIERSLPLESGEQLKPSAQFASSEVRALHRRGQIAIVTRVTWRKMLDGMRALRDIEQAMQDDSLDVGDTMLVINNTLEGLR